MRTRRSTCLSRFCFPFTKMQLKQLKVIAILLKYRGLKYWFIKECKVSQRGPHVKLVAKCFTEFQVLKGFCSFILILIQSKAKVIKTLIFCILQWKLYSLRRNGREVRGDWLTLKVHIFTWAKGLGDRRKIFHTYQKINRLPLFYLTKHTRVQY